MIKILKYFCLILLLASLINPRPAQAQGTLSFDDACAYPPETPANKHLNYGMRHIRVKFTTVDSGDGGSTNESFIEQYSGINFTAYGTNYGCTHHIYVDQGPVNDACETASTFWYGCGYYGGSEGSAGSSLAMWLNWYIEGDAQSLQDASVKSVSEHHTGIDYNVTIVTSNSPTATTTYADSAELSDPYLPTCDANFGKDHGGTNCPCKCHAMPVWFVTEPYLNLWVKDQPVFYKTSLGQEINFEVSYKQHDTRPGDTSVPTTGWSHNWFSYVHFVVPTYVGSTNSTGPGLSMPGDTGPVSISAGWVFTNDFSKWQAILYASDDGENYFDYHDQTDVEAGLKLMAADGVDAHIYPYSDANPAGSTTVSGFKLVHADGSVDVYNNVSSPKFSFGLVQNEGRTYDAMTNFGRFFSLGAKRYGDYGETDLSEDGSSESAVGMQMGYVACDAVLTERIDPYGNSIHLYYDTGSKRRLQTIVDYDGRTTTLTYDHNGMLTNVAMPYGRNASFVYSSQLLTKIIDAEGMQSTFSYTVLPYTQYPYGRSPSVATNTYLNSLSTPYGTTSFNHYEAPPI